LPRCPLPLNRPCTCSCTLTHVFSGCKAVCHSGWAGEATKKLRAASRRGGRASRGEGEDRRQALVPVIENMIGTQNITWEAVSRCDRAGPHRAAAVAAAYTQKGFMPRHLACIGVPTGPPAGLTGLGWSRLLVLESLCAVCCPQRAQLLGSLGAHNHRLGVVAAAREKGRGMKG
jgi:hypothetical protein